MSFDELIRIIAENASRLHYIRLYLEEKKIEYALAEVPERAVSHFANREELTRTWSGLVHLLTKMCKPPHVEIGNNIMFQPALVSAVLRHSNEIAHFVVLKFLGGHNLAMGSLVMGEREEKYLAFCELFGVDPADGSPPPTIQ